MYSSSTEGIKQKRILEEGLTRFELPRFFSLAILDEFFSSKSPGCRVDFLLCQILSQGRTLGEQRGKLLTDEDQLLGTLSTSLGGNDED